MKNQLFYVMFVFIILGCSTSKRMCNLRKIYEDISACHGNQELIGKSLKYCRIELDYLNNFEYSSQNDTIYILEIYGVQGNVLITIWNKNQTLSYTNEQGYFEIKNDTALFTKYMMKLVTEWNIPGIKKEEVTNSDILPGELIYATKIVFTKGKYYLDCICFKDFFNLKRDGMSLCY